jgi:hypothetical protein
VQTKAETQYQQTMGPVDNANGHIMASLPGFKMLWTGHHAIYLLTAFMICNGRVYYMSDHGLQDLERLTWIDEVHRAWVPQCIADNGILESKDNRKRCLVCYEKFRKVTQTKKRCPRCGPVCKHCHGSCQKSGKQCEQWQQGTNAQCGGPHSGFSVEVHKHTFAPRPD